MTISIVVIAGPTASGKSALAMELADRLGGEIVNADSQQVYRGLDVGTAKPSPEDRAEVPHHLIGVADPDEQLTAARFVELADEAIGDIASRTKLPLVVGGSGLWLRALLRGLIAAPPRDESIRSRLGAEAKSGPPGCLHDKLREVDPEAAARLHPNDLVRIIRALEVHELTGSPLSAHIASSPFGGPRYRHRLLALDPDRGLLKARIEERTNAMLGGGWLEEVGSLLRRGHSRERLAKVLGYEEVISHLDGEIDLEEANRRISKRTLAYAKRQLVWLRKEQDVEWLTPPIDPESLAAELRSWMA